MDRFAGALDAHTVLGLDSSVFIYHLEAHPRYRPLTLAVLQGLQTGRWAGVTSAVALMEITVRPWQLAQPAVAQQYEVFLAHYPNLTLADVTRDVARRAARLRADYRIAPADALQIATTLLHGGSLFVTNDRRLTRLRDRLDVLILDAFAPSPST